MNRLNEQSQRVIQLASDEARLLNHDFVGTEHILLGLMLEGSCEASGLLQRLGLTLRDVRVEIEKMIQRGVAPVQANDIPLTPRARRAIQLAGEIAADVSLLQVAPEHLLIGLIREPDGVAGLVLRNLGLDLGRVAREALKIRVSQMRIIERIVRPLRAGAKHKRRIREELLAHLTSIYDEERKVAADPFVAMDVAGKRFGDQAALSRELQDSVPFPESCAWHIEHWLGWRAPESVSRMMLRTSFIGFITILSIGALVFGAGAFKGNWSLGQSEGLQFYLPLALLTSATQFALGMCYYKIRDALWGAFGSRRSLLRAGLYSMLASAVAFGAGLAVLPLYQNTSAGATVALPLFGGIGALVGLTILSLARWRGSTEIRDTIWATLDLKTAG